MCVDEVGIDANKGLVVVSDLSLMPLRPLQWSCQVYRCGLVHGHWHMLLVPLMGSLAQDGALSMHTVVRMMDMLG